MKPFFLFLCLGITFSFSQPLVEKTLTNEINLAISDGVRFDDGSWIFSAFAYSITPGDSAMSIVFKTDSTFTPLWSKRFKYLRRDDFSCITPLMDGNVLIGGTMRQDFSLQNGGSVYKLDTAGNVLWHMMYDESFDDRVLDIFEQSDSSLMIFIRKGVTNQASKVVHASKNGEILYQREFTILNTSLGLLANAVVSDENERYYFSGNVQNQGEQELYVCAVDDSSLYWYKRFRFEDRSIGNFVSSYVHADQTILLGGTIVDTVGIFVNIWLAKVDLQGNLVWAKEYGQDLGFTENPSVIAPLPSGELLIYGNVFDDQGSKVYGMKLDAMGNLLWIKGYTPSSPTIGIGDAFSLPDGRMLLNANNGGEIFLMTTTAEGQNVCSIAEVSMNVATLTASDTTYDVVASDPELEEFVPPIEVYAISINDSVLCSGFVSIDEGQVGDLEIYPNPAHMHLNVILPHARVSKLDCHIVDAFGRRIAPVISQSSDEIHIDLSEIATGIYWLFLQIDGEHYSEQFVRR